MFARRSLLEADPGLSLGLLCFFAAGFENAATLTFRASAPYTVVDAVLECVFEAWLLHGALCADTLGDFDTHTVAREEGFRGLVGTQPSGHPVWFHVSSTSVFV